MKYFLKFVTLLIFVKLDFNLFNITEPHTKEYERKPQVFVVRPHAREITSEHRSNFAPSKPSPQLALLSATVFQEVVKHFETPALSPPYSLSTEGNVDQSMRSNLTARVNIGVIGEHFSTCIPESAFPKLE